MICSAEIFRPTKLRGLKPQATFGTTIGINNSPRTMSSKQKGKGKNAGGDDPFATAQVRAILDPEQADTVNGKLEEIRSTGASVAIAAPVEGSIERIVSVGGNPETVGTVSTVPEWNKMILICVHRDMKQFYGPFTGCPSARVTRRKKMKEKPWALMADRPRSPFDSSSLLSSPVLSPDQTTLSSNKSKAKPVSLSQ